MTSVGQAAPLYLCLDQGGHSSRALVIDGGGQVHASAGNPVVTRRDGDRVEHDPAELVNTLLQAAAEAISELGAGADRIVAAGLATQRSSVVCWDSQTGDVLSPVLSWQDTRAAEYLARYESHWQRVHDITGLVLSPHYGVSKLRWCLEHLPAVEAARVAGRLRFGPLASFLAMRLTAGTNSYADPANASRTLLWDRSRRNWSAELLDLFSVPADCLPPCVPSRYEWGELNVAERNIPLTVVTGDQSAALFAFGMPTADTTYINIGTGAFLQRMLPDTQLDPGRLLASVVYQDAAHATAVIEGTVNGAGSALTLVAGQLGIDRERLHRDSAIWLQTVSDPPLFINSVAGLGSPWWRVDVEPEFVTAANRCVEAQDEAKIVAVMESIVFLLTVNLRRVDEQLGSGDRIVATGGLAAVSPLLQRLSDLTGMVVQRARVREATATGLAYLLAGLPEQWPGVEADSTFTPAANVGLRQRFDAWLKCMPAA